jgi:hypothetical protein
MVEDGSPETASEVQVDAPASKLEVALIWVFMVDNAVELRDLPGLSPDPKKGKYLLDQMDGSEYWEFATCPPAIHTGAKSAKQNMVNVRLQALHNFWWNYILKEPKPSKSTVLPHPEKLGISALQFVQLYMPESARTTHYRSPKLVNPKPLQAKYDGKPEKFKIFYETLKAAAANTSMELLRCIENEVYAKSFDEFNNVLYNWLVGCMDQDTVELHFYPNKGNGYAALQSLINDPIVQANKGAQIELSKTALTKLKCKGTDINSFVCRFKTLAKKALLTSDTELIREFIKGFSKESPYWDRLRHLMAQHTSFKDICDGLVNYYTSNIVMFQGIAEKSQRQQDPEDKGGEEGGKRKRRGKQQPQGKDAGKGTPPAKCPRIHPDDYSKLSAEEKKQLRDTGKITGYVIEADPDSKEVHRAKKVGKESGGKSKSRRATEDSEGSDPEDDDSTARALYKLYGF